MYGYSGEKTSTMLNKMTLASKVLNLIAAANKGLEKAKQQREEYAATAAAPVHYYPRPAKAQKRARASPSPPPPLLEAPGSPGWGPPPRGPLGEGRGKQMSRVHTFI